MHMPLLVLRSSRLLAVVVSAAVVCVAIPRAQEVMLDPLLAVMQADLRDTYQHLANLVVDEDYVQTTDNASRQLASELLLVRHPIDQRDWLVFRDVLRVDGRAVAEHQQRLTELFITPTAEAWALVSEINNASNRYQLNPPHFALTNPFVVVGLLDRSYASRLQFTLEQKGRKDRGPEGARAITFAERVESGDDSPSLFGIGTAYGAVWLDPNNGRIAKTELFIGYKGASAFYYGTTATTFRYDAELRVIVPVEMQTRWRNVTGKAKYTRVRRFGIQTDESLTLPPATSAPPRR
jgi:hypothetical protein